MKIHRFRRHINRFKLALACAVFKPRPSGSGAASRLASAASFVGCSEQCVAPRHGDRAPHRSVSPATAPGECDYAERRCEPRTDHGSDAGPRCGARHRTSGAIRPASPCRRCSKCYCFCCARFCRLGHVLFSTRYSSVFAYNLLN